MRSLFRRLTQAAALAVWVAVLPAMPALAQTTGGGPPAGFVAPAEPKPDENNAARTKSQPGNNAPFWRAVRESGTQAGFTSLPGLEKGTLVQGFRQYPGSSYTTAGEAWRQVRNRWIVPYGGALLLIAAAAMAMFHWRTGGIGGHEVNTGRLIERFTYFERAAHWAVAISFVILGVSGVVIALGKFLLLPILGSTLFGWLTYAMKNLHNFAGPVFAVALLIFIVGYVRDNLPHASDLGWLAKGGGMLTGEHVPSGKFNAGEKIVFWAGAVGLGLIVVASGLVLDHLVPTIDYTRSTMQIANIVHGVSSFFMMAMLIGHAYMGSIGVKGSFQAMRTGYVDEAWAKDHHELWYDDIKAGRIPAIRSDAPVPTSGAGAAQTRAQ
jgi:formate dehydrogenase subunit gamma